eukprot:2583058-Rhodomonas_salina.1
MCSSSSSSSSMYAREHGIANCDVVPHHHTGLSCADGWCDLFTTGCPVIPAPSIILNPKRGTLSGARREGRQDSVWFLSRLAHPLLKANRPPPLLLLLSLSRRLCLCWRCLGGGGRDAGCEGSAERFGVWLESTALQLRCALRVPGRVLRSAESVASVLRVW